MKALKVSKQNLMRFFFIFVNIESTSDLSFCNMANLEMVLLLLFYLKDKFK